MLQSNAVRLLIALGIALVGVTAWQFWPRPEPPRKKYGSVLVEFKDQVETNARFDPEVLKLSFVDSAGQSVKLEDFRGKKHVLMVFTRGYFQQVCPYCTVQVSRLINNYAEFAKREAEVLVVYPGAKEKLEDFLHAVHYPTGPKPTPFPLLLDVDLGITAKLGLKAELAKPSTFLLDKEGNLRFVYVGASEPDRPSVKAMLAELDKLQPAIEPAATAPVPVPSPLPEAKQ